MRYGPKKREGGVLDHELFDGRFNFRDVALGMKSFSDLLLVRDDRPYITE